MHPNLFLSALRARLGVFLLALAATIAAATALSLLMPKSYRATVSLSVSEPSLGSGFVPPHERMAFLQTQADIIASDRVARRVVERLQLARDPALRESFEQDADGRGSIEDWLAATLLERLKIATSQSSILQVRFFWRDPERAAAGANAFALAYIDTVTELRAAPATKAASVFDEQLKALKATLGQAQARLTDYQRRHGIVATSDSLDIEQARLTELSSQLVKAQDHTFELQSRQEQARRAVAQGDALDQLTDVQANTHVQKLGADLAQGEAKLQELATQYGANYPAYQRQLAENRARRARLHAEMRKVVAGFDSALRQSRQRENELRSALAAQRARLLDLKGERGEMALLVRDVDSAQKSYEAAMQRFAVSLPEGRAGQSSVAVLSPAVAPRQPYQPRIALNVALSVVVGTMLGFGMVILREMSDRRVRSFVDLDERGQVPLLGVLDAWTPPERLPAVGAGWRRLLPRPAP